MDRLDNKTKLEQIQEKVIEIQKKFDNTITPQKNHKLFEINLESDEITLAVFDEVPILKWEDAVSGNYRNQRKITRKLNCVYVSSLNVKNVHKILKRDHGIIINNN